MQGTRSPDTISTIKMSKSIILCTQKHTIPKAILKEVSEWVEIWILSGK